MDNGASSYRRFIDGDDKGLSEIVRDYRIGLILYLNGIVNNISIAEELMEETLFKIITKKPRFNAKYSFKTWLYTIGRNVAIDYLRHNAKQSDTPFDDLENYIQDEFVLEKLYIIEERKIAVHKALKKLNPEYRQVLWLLYFDGMKNYDELTNDLLARRDRYVADQKKKRKRVMGVATSLCCFCLVALLGFGMWQSGVFVTTPPDQTIDDALYPGIKYTFDDKNGEFPDNSAANNKFVVNAINGVSADKMNIALMVDDFVEMSPEEMCEYYGVDYIPDIPADIKPWPEQRSGIYKRNGGTGEVYWDADILNYSNEDFTRSVHIEVDKGSYVLQDYLFFKGTEEKSITNNHEVLIGLSENGYYYSEFMYNSVGFLVDAEGVTLDEFVAIISSIIK